MHDQRHAYYMRRPDVDSRLIGLVVDIDPNPNLFYYGIVTLSAALDDPNEFDLVTWTEDRSNAIDDEESTYDREMRLR